MANIMNIAAAWFMTILFVLSFTTVHVEMQAIANVTDPNAMESFIGSTGPWLYLMAIIFMFTLTIVYTVKDMR